MIIFHEGLPRSGKSYEAVTNQVLKYLKQGRKCFCFVDGLNYQMFSDILGIDISDLKGYSKVSPISVLELPKHKYTRNLSGQLHSVEYFGLLHQIDEDQVLNIYDFVEDDSFVVLDELQDYFPVSTKPLDKNITKFVTQHGHRGLDLLVMGQAHEDCHNLWKRRIDQLISFEKRDAIGRADTYTWRAYKQTKAGNRFKFVHLRSGKGTYEKKYFGLYKSHVSGVNNVLDHDDDRANVFKSKVFTFYIPCFLILLSFAFYYLYSFFTDPEIHEIKKDKISSSNSLKTSDNKYKLTKPDLSDIERKALLTERSKLKELQAKKKLEQLEAKIELERVKFSYSEYIKTVISDYKPRLSGVIYSKKKVFAYVEFLDESYHVKERLNLEQLKDLGWTYERHSYGIKLINGKDNHVVTSWPIDSRGKVSARTAPRLNTTY